MKRTSVFPSYLSKGQVYFPSVYENDKCIHLLSKQRTSLFPPVFSPPVFSPPVYEKDWCVPLLSAVMYNCRPGKVEPTMGSGSLGFDTEFQCTPTPPPPPPPPPPPTRPLEMPCHQADFYLWGDGGLLIALLNLDIALNL
jgi:hypothetical protein